MRHLCFAAAVGALAASVLAGPRRAAAQGVPGRDLLDFPLGALGEAPALAVEAAGGLFNPAAPLLAAGRGVRGSASHVNAPGERGVSGELVALDWRIRPRTALSVSVARAGVGAIPRTGESVDVLPGDVLYDTFVLSTGVARRVQRHLAVGAAVRYRVGRADTSRAATVGTDAGIVVDGLLGRRDLRLGLSSFLWRPDAAPGDRPATTAGADLRVFGDGAAREVRLGVSHLGSAGGERERYGYVHGRIGYVEGRAGIARATLAGGAGGDTRLRLGVGLRHARFVVGITREEGQSHLGPLYQFTLSSMTK